MENDRPGNVWQHPALLTVAPLVCAWFVKATDYFQADSLPLASAIPGACLYVLSMFGLFCILALVTSLHHGPAEAAIVSSAACLCWCAAELLLPFAPPVSGRQQTARSHVCLYNSSHKPAEENENGDPYLDHQRNYDPYKGGDE